MVRAVLDANVYVSALLNPHGPPGRILSAWIERSAFTLVASTAIAAEIRATLAKPKVATRTALRPAEITQWVSNVMHRVDMVVTESRLRVVVTDPDDDKYLEAAEAGRAGFVVTGDRHLLDLKTHAGISIVPPTAFMAVLDVLRT